MTNSLKNHPLILITGIGRSGTTWLGKIFDSHPAILYRNEPESELPLGRVPKHVFESHAHDFRQSLLDYLPKLAHMQSANVVGIPPFFRKQDESASRFRIQKGLFFVSRYLSRVIETLPFPRRFSDAELARLRVCWKSVEATGRIPAFLDAVPETNVALVVRHPCGCLASRIRGVLHGFKPLHTQIWRLQEVNALLNTSASEGITLTANSVKNLDPQELFVVWWALQNAKAILDLQSKQGCTVIRYESLCEDPIGVMRATFRVVGLPWDAQTEQFLKASTSQHSSRYYSLFKNPAESANRWKSELSKDLQHRVAELVADSIPGRLFYHGQDTSNRSTSDARSNHE